MESHSSQRKQKGIDLDSPWTVYVDANPSSSFSGSSEGQVANNLQMGQFNTVEGFWRFWNHVGEDKNRFKKFPRNCDVKLFKSHIKPTIQDPNNVNGGEWTIEIARQWLDFAWIELAIAAVAENLIDSVCGIILSLRADAVELRIWSSDSVVGEDEETPLKIRTTLKLSQSIPVIHTLHCANRKVQTNGVANGSIGISGSKGSVLKYENDFMKQARFKKQCDTIASDLAAFDWSKLKVDVNHAEGESAEEKVASLGASEGPRPPGPGFENGTNDEGSSERKETPKALSIKEKNAALLRIKLPTHAAKSPRRHHKPVNEDAPTVEKLYPLPKVPKVKTTTLGDDHAGGPEVPIHQDIEGEIVSFREFYQIEVVEELNEDLHSVLDTEGCPKCLRGVDDYEGPYVVFQCKTMKCYHVIHLPCVQTKNPGATPRRSRPLTTIRSYHSTQYFRVSAVSQQDPDVQVIPRNPPGTRSNCSIELELSHILSDATGLRIKWPHTVSSLMDHRSGQEFLHLSLESSSKPAADRTPLPLFRAKRGRIVFKCTDHVQQQTFEHDCNYDITKMNDQTMKLQLWLGVPRHCLTIGVKRSLTQKSAEDAFMITFVKYEFGAPVQSPVVLSIPQAYPDPMSPLVQTIRSPAGVIPVSPMIMGQPGRVQGRYPFAGNSPLIHPQSPLMTQPTPLDARNQPHPINIPVSPITSHPATSSTANGVRKMNHQTNFSNFPHVFGVYPPSPRMPGQFMTDGPTDNGFHHHPFAGFSGGAMSSSSSFTSYNANVSADHTSPQGTPPGGAPNLHAVPSSGASSVPPVSAPSVSENSSSPPSSLKDTSAGGKTPGNTTPQQTPSPVAVSTTPTGSGGPQPQSSVKRGPRRALNKSRFEFVQDTPVVSKNETMELLGNGHKTDVAAPQVPVPTPSETVENPQSAAPPQVVISPAAGAGGGAHTQPTGDLKQPNNSVPQASQHAVSPAEHSAVPGGPQPSPNSMPSSPSSFQLPNFGNVSHTLNSQLLLGSAGQNTSSLSSPSHAALVGTTGISGANNWSLAGSSPSLQNSMHFKHGNSPGHFNQYSPHMPTGPFLDVDIYQNYMGSPNNRHLGFQQSMMRNQSMYNRGPMGSMPSIGSGPMGMNPNGGLMASSTNSALAAITSGSPHPSNISPDQLVQPADVMDHIRGRVFMLSKSQSGSRFVQDKLNDPVYFTLFFDELKEKIAELMMDNFGHYAIEALMEGCNDEQRLILVKNLAPQIGMVACHKQGSFSIQAMMDTLRSQVPIQCLCDALSEDIVKIILNCSGHYVILRFLQRFGYPYTQFIHQAICDHTIEFATDHYGLRVLKAVADAGPASEIKDVYAALVKNTNELVENQYGNYIVQHLLEVAPKNVQEMIKQKMDGKFVRFAKQKFSSNVVERCLRNSGMKWRQIVIRQLLESAGELISDKYGNYCLQTALQSCDRQMVAEFTEAVSPHLGSLRENVKVKWKKILDQANKKHTQMSSKGKPGGPNNSGPGGKNSSSKHGPNGGRNIPSGKYSQGGKHVSNKHASNSGKNASGAKSSGGKPGAGKNTNSKNSNAKG